MKKKRLLQAVCVLVLACLTLTLCSCNSTKDYPEKIIGEWHLSNWETKGDDRDDYRNDLWGDYLIFSKAGNCDGGLFDLISYQGTWRITGKTLEISGEDQINRYSILVLNEEKLILLFENYDGIVTKLAYKKVR
ncbi:MAG: lipocalin family protein [Faecousia sp.]